MEDKYSCFKVTFSDEERIKCLKEIISRVNKILYVYDKSMQDSKYDYKLFCGGILLFVASSNDLFNGDLLNTDITLKVNLNSIISKDLDKAQIKRLVFETKNILDKQLKFYKDRIGEDR